jgi:hypothetical protein
VFAWKVVMVEVGPRRVVHPADVDQVTMGYDRYPELLIDEKRRFLQDKTARGVRLFFTHDLACALATPQRDDQQRFGVTLEHPTVEGERLPT